MGLLVDFFRWLFPLQDSEEPEVFEEGPELEVIATPGLPILNINDPVLVNDPLSNHDGLTGRVTDISYTVRLSTGDEVLFDPQSLDPIA